MVCRADVPSGTLRAVYGAVDAEVIAYGHFHGNHVLTLDDKLLVHNYGHGGSGFTLSWGCARDVLNLATL